MLVFSHMICQLCKYYSGLLFTSYLYINILLKRNPHSLQSDLLIKSFLKKYTILQTIFSIAINPSEFLKTIKILFDTGEIFRKKNLTEEKHFPMEQ